MRPVLGSRASVGAVVTWFLYNGLVMGLWMAAIPALKLRAGVNAATFSIALVSMGLGAIASMQVSARLVERLGTRRICLIMSGFLMVGILAVGFAPNMGWLVAAAVIVGIGQGGLDVAMNALGVQVEAARPKPVMSAFHAMWSIGNVTGAGLMLLVANTIGVTWPDTVVLASCIFAALIGFAAVGLGLRLTPDAVPEKAAEVSEGGRRIPRAAWILGLMAIAFGLGEGTAMDWSGLHISKVAGVAPNDAGIAVVVVASFMVAIRLLGDRLVARFGRRAVVRFGGVCAAAGYVVTVFATPLPLLLTGWGLVGLGIGLIAPQVYAVAGHSFGPRGLATVVTFGYATFLAGPAITGSLIELFGIQHAMVLPAVLLLGLPFLASVMPDPAAAPRGQDPTPA